MPLWTSTKRISLPIFGVTILVVSLLLSSLVHALVGSFVLLVNVVVLLLLLPSATRAGLNRQRSITALVTFLSLVGAILLWYLFWNFPQLATGTRPGVYNLDLAGLCMLTVAATVILAAVAFGNYKHKAEKLISAIVLLLMCSIFLLIFLRYVVVPPLNWVDLATTGVFFTIIALIVSLVGLTIARSLPGGARKS
jgi:hypothetical protein